MSVEPKSMEDTLRETYATMDSDETESDGKEQAVEAEDAPAVKVKSYTRKKPAKEKSEHDVHGDEQPEPDAVLVSESVAAPDEDSVLPEASGLQPLPSGWRGAVKEHWATMPNEVREEILKREADVQKFVSQRGQAAKFGEELYSEFQPYEAMLRAEGATPQLAVRELLKTAYLLRTADPARKANLIAGLATQYGVDLGALSQGEIPQIDPVVSHLQQQIEQLNRQISQQGTAYQSQEDGRLMDEINSFKSQPGREHFDALIQPMAIRLQNGQASTLEQAYDQEVWANPETRKLMQTAQITKRQTEAKAQAEAARQSAQVNVQKRGSVGTGAKTKGSIEDTLRAEFKRITA